MGPQFPYLCNEGLDILFVTLAFSGCQTAFWTGELVKALEWTAEMSPSTL